MIAKVKDYRLIGIISFIIVLCLSTVAMTLAYFTDNGEVDNTLSIGQIDTEIIEDFEAPKNLIDTEQVKKIVRIRNNGPNPAYVRVFCEFSDSRVDANFDTENGFATIDYNPTSFIDEEGNEATAEGLWTEPDTDGWRYYTVPLLPGDISDPVMTKVSIKEGAQESQLVDFEIIVVHESIQTSFSEGGQLVTKTYEEAWNMYN